MGQGLTFWKQAQILQFYAKFDPNFPESHVSRLLNEGKELTTLKGMSGDEELFIAVAPSILETVGELAHDSIDGANSDEAYAFITFLEGVLNLNSDEAYAFITFLEGVLNLNFEEDVIAGLTGEIALTVDDLTMFEPDAIVSLDVDIENTLQIDATNVHTRGGLIFNSTNPSKWDQIKNSVSNRQNTSVSKTDYEGTDVSVFTSNIYYAEKDGLSLLSFSEDQMYSMVDGLNKKKKMAYLKQVPKTPLVFVKLNIMKLLELIDGAVQVEDDGVTSDDIAPLLAWITVNEDKAMLEITISDKESPIEVFLKFVPYIASQVNNYEN